MLLWGSVVPRALTSVSVNVITGQHLAQLQSADLSALWGIGRALRCKESIFTLRAREHVADLYQAVDYLRMITWQCILIRRPDLRTCFRTVWHATAHEGSDHLGLDVDGGGESVEEQASESELRIHRWTRRSELAVEGADSACRHNQDARIRGTGYDCFWGLGHASNVAETFGGTGAKQPEG